MPFGKQSGEGAALPAALWLAVMAREGGAGAARSAQREDTARLDDDARHARRLAIDRQTQGCVADETNRKDVGAGVSRACPVDPPARLQIIVDRALARASTVSILQSPRWRSSMPLFRTYWLVKKTGTPPRLTLDL